jgi:plasmid stabilization system protein ParE
MAREVVWSLPAADDLDLAASFIARDSEAYAAALVADVLDAAESLSEFANRGQVVPEIGDESTREVLVRPYRIVYRVEPSRVVIIALVHGARRGQRH